MKCPRCHADNPDTSRFCGNCATQLPESIQLPAALTKTLESLRPALSKGSLVAGKYQIIEEIGRGGMGEVYKARDTRLDRTVAIKVLPPEVQQHPERQARFEREAKAISQLSHPHICTLHDIGREGDAVFLVMELLEGESLAARLERKPKGAAEGGGLPLHEVLEIGSEIAGALQAAHRQGIIHRDLKPGNVMLTKTGAKLLDFGLAKLRPMGAVAMGATSVPTKSASATAEGTLLGTLPYMAPEQLEGKDADARTDIWALGCVLYEMAGGRRAFEGESEASLIGAIMNAEPPPLPAVQPLAPPALEHIVRACLAKDPDERWQSAADVERELRWIADEARNVQTAAGVESKSTSLAGARVRWPLVIPWALTAAAVALSIAIFIIGRRTAPSAPVMHVSIPLAPEAPFEGHVYENIAISRDGLRLAYSSAEGVYARKASDDAFRKIPGTESGYWPFFSPDGLWLGFLTPTGLYKVPVSGGAPVRITELASLSALGGYWSADDTILFNSSGAGGIDLVSATGGTPRRLIRPDPTRGESFLLFPQRPARSNVLLMTVGPDYATSPDECQIVLEDPADAGSRAVLASGASGRYLPTGHLMFGRGTSILVAPIDLAARKLTGPSEPIVNDVMTNMLGVLKAAVSDTGTLAYVPGQMQGAGPARLFVINRHGGEQPLGQPQPFEIRELSASPDGLRVAMRAVKFTDDIHIYDIQAGTFSRATFEGGDENAPVWAPDGKSFAYDRRGGFYRRRMDESGESEMVVDSRVVDSPSGHPSAFSPNGRWLLYSRLDPKTGWDIWKATLDGERKAEPLLQNQWNELNATFSPDGRWLAYESDESGKMQVHLRRFPDLGDKRQISIDGGAEPLWSPLQNELFFRNGSDLMVSAITVGVTVQSRLPTVVLENVFRGETRSFGWPYAVLPDAQHFVIARNAQMEPVREIRLVTNWFEELKAKVPARR